MSIFSDNLLSGNPAAVILLDEKTFENEALLKKISARINLSETSFVLCEENHFKIKFSISEITDVKTIADIKRHLKNHNIS